MKLIETPTALTDACERLSRGATYYLDTEFESTRNGSTLCLVQIATGSEIYIIDPLRVTDLRPLGEVLCRVGNEWVLHAGTQDVTLLLRAFRVEQPPRLFDTQVAWAMSSPEASVSLTYLQFQLLGYRTEKAHQADDWTRRPLPKQQLSYAAGDVEHLPEMHAALCEATRQLGREHLVAEASREVDWPAPEPPARLSLRSFRNAWQLSAAGQAALRELISWYNACDAEEWEAGPESKTLLAIASRMPEDVSALSRLKGVPRGWCRRHGEALVSALKRAREQAVEADFEPIDPPPYATFEEIRLDGWLGALRAELCCRVTMAPDLALPGRLVRRMRELALDRGDLRRTEEALTGWRRELLAPTWAELVRHYSAAPSRGSGGGRSSTLPPHPRPGVPPAAR